MIDADAVNVGERFVLWSNGRLTTITSLFDQDGDVTGIASEAVFAVAPTPDGQWTCIDLSQYQTVRVN